MLHELYKEAAEWLEIYDRADENWWALKGEGQGMCLSVNLESAIKHAEKYYDLEAHADILLRAKNALALVNVALFG